MSRGGSHLSSSLGWPGDCQPFPGQKTENTQGRQQDWRPIRSWATKGSCVLVDHLRKSGLPLGPEPSLLQSPLFSYILHDQNALPRCLCVSWRLPRNQPGQGFSKWVLDQRHQLHLGTRSRCKFLGFISDRLNRELGVGPSKMCSNTPPGDSDA